MGQIELKERKITFGIRFIYYVLLILLIGILIIPHTSILSRDDVKIPLLMGMNKTTIVLLKGQKTKLSIVGITKRVEYKVLNPKIASVNRYGVIKGKSKGKTVVKVIVKGKVIKCSLIVK